MMTNGVVKSGSGLTLFL